MKHIFITGKPKSGKTTLFKELIPYLKDEGGFYTQEVLYQDKRIGFEIITLDGRRGLLARKGLSSPFNLGSYGVDVKDLDEIGVAAIEEAIENKKVIVIDEIGKMELYSKRFKEVVLKALDSGKFLLGIIHQANLPFLERIKKRDDVLILELTSENRGEVFKTIKGIIDSWL
ncbi:MAG: NTPase [bacterium]